MRIQHQRIMNTKNKEEVMHTNENSDHSTKISNSIDSHSKRKLDNNSTNNSKVPRIAPQEHLDISHMLESNQQEGNSSSSITIAPFVIKRNINIHLQFTNHYKNILKYKEQLPYETIIQEIKKSLFHYLIHIDFNIKKNSQLEAQINIILSRFYFENQKTLLTPEILKSLFILNNKNENELLKLIKNKNQTVIAPLAEQRAQQRIEENLPILRQASSLDISNVKMTKTKALMFEKEAEKLFDKEKECTNKLKDYSKNSSFVNAEHFVTHLANTEILQLEANMYRNTAVQCLMRKNTILREHEILNRTVIKNQGFFQSNQSEQQDNTATNINNTDFSNKI